LQYFQLLRRWIENLAAGRSVWNELLLIILCLDQCRPGADADHRGTFGHILRDNGIGTDPCPLADRDRTQNLRAGAQYDIILDRRMALAADAIGRIRTAQRYALVDSDIVANYGGLPDNGKAVIDEQMASDPGAGMNIDRGQKSGQMVDETREEIELALEQPVRQTMQAESQHPRIEQHLPARSRSRIAGLDGIQISAQFPKHIFPPDVAKPIN